MVRQPAAGAFCFQQGFDSLQALALRLVQYDEQKLRRGKGVA
jgi:hypothetical protein